MSRRTEVFWMAIIMASAFLLRTWDFSGTGEIGEDEAFFFGRSMMLLNRESIWGWIAILETDYGIAVLAANALNYLVLKALLIPIDEGTIQYTSLVFGSLGLITAYLAVREVSREYLPALVTAALVAVTPSQVAQSRSIAGNWIVATCLFWLAIFCLTRYAKDSRAHFALCSGLALAVYLQADGLQLVLLAFAPILLWLLQERDRPYKPLYFWSVVGFAIFFAIGGVLVHPAVLRLLAGSERVAQWNVDILTRLETYCVVSLMTAAVVALLLFVARVAEEPARSVARRIAHPLLLIPVLSSFAANVAVAVSTARINGEPQGILGHGLAKGPSLGIYVAPFLSDISGILGWPLTLFTFVFIGPAIWASRRSRSYMALGILCVLTSLPWLFAVPPHATGRAWYMLTCASALTAFATVGLFETAPYLGLHWPRKPHDRVILGVPVSAMILTTLPFTLAQVFQKPVLGISMPWKDGANLPSKGTRAAFEYFVEHARTSDTVFTDSPHWTPRFYLYVKSSRGFSRDAIRAVPYSQRREIFAYFEKQGKTADWYVISSTFLQAVRENRFEGMALRAVAEGRGGSTLVWQRGYDGPVQYLPPAGVKKAAKNGN